jgi:putative endonuclease
MYYVYLLKSKLNGELYRGSTNDLKYRFKEHNDGKVFSTKRYRPWKLIYYEAFAEEKLARLREQKLKHNGNAMHELKKRLGL